MTVPNGAGLPVERTQGRPFSALLISAFGFCKCVAALGVRVLCRCSDCVVSLSALATIIEDCVSASCSRISSVAPTSSCFCIPEPKANVLCCNTCVNSCAINLLPSLVSGLYSPSANTTSLPTVYANAFTACADSAALASVCIFTWLNSCPKRSSINALVPASNDCPDELSTSCTIGGTPLIGAACTAARSIIPSCCWRHSSHSPPATVC